MKKIKLTVLALALALALGACGEKATNSNNALNSESSSVENSQESTSNVEWKEFLSEYEAWVDKYIEITKKYNDNPTDMTILTDYTNMMTELAEWTTKTEEMKTSLENASPGELMEYSAELARIAAKLVDIAY